MTEFSYIALDDKGKESRGTVNAGNGREVAQILRRQSLYPVSIQEFDGTGRGGGSARFQMPRIGAGIKRHMPATRGDIMFLFRQFALMLRAGHTAVETLEISSNLVGKKSLSHALARIADAVRSGSSLSAAMAREDKLFKPLMTNLVAAGEASGTLDTVLERIADNIDSALELRRQLITATLYPTIVIIVSFLVLWFLMTKAIPMLASYFARRNITLPPLTQFLIDMSDFMILVGPYLAGAVGLGTFLALAASRTKRGKHVLDVMALHLPIFGKSILLSLVARFGTTLSLLLDSGLTVVDSLRVMSNVMGNSVFVSLVDRAADSILAGQTLAASLTTKQMPDLVQHMAAIGEKSGELDTVMESVGTHYYGLLRVRVSRLVAIIGPVLILAVGGFVAVIYIATFQAAIQASLSR